MQRNREGLSSAASALLLLRLPARPPVTEHKKMELLMALVEGFVEGLLSLLLDAMWRLLQIAMASWIIDTHEPI